MRKLNERPRMILPDLKHALARGKTQQMLSSRHMYHVPLAKHWGFSTVFDPGRTSRPFGLLIFSRLRFRPQYRTERDQSEALFHSFSERYNPLKSLKPLAPEE